MPICPSFPTVAVSGGTGVLQGCWGRGGGLPVVGQLVLAGIYEVRMFCGVLLPGQVQYPYDSPRDAQPPPPCHSMVFDTLGRPRDRDKDQVGISQGALSGLPGDLGVSRPVLRVQCGQVCLPCWPCRVSRWQTEKALPADWHGACPALC